MRGRDLGERNGLRVERERIGGGGGGGLALFRGKA